MPAEIVAQVQTSVSRWDHNADRGQGIAAFERSHQAEEPFPCTGVQGLYDKHPLFPHSLCDFLTPERLNYATTGDAKGTSDISYRRPTYTHPDSSPSPGKNVIPTFRVEPAERTRFPTISSCTPSGYRITLSRITHSMSLFSALYSIIVTGKM